MSTKNARTLGIRLDEKTNARLEQFEQATLIEGVSLARAAQESGQQSGVHAAFMAGKGHNPQDAAGPPGMAGTPSPSRPFFAPAVAHRQITPTEHPGTSSGRAGTNRACPLLQ